MKNRLKKSVERWHEKHHLPLAIFIKFMTMAGGHTLQMVFFIFYNKASIIFIIFSSPATGKIS